MADLFDLLDEGIVGLLFPHLGSVRLSGSSGFSSGGSRGFSGRDEMVGRWRCGCGCRFQLCCGWRCQRWCWLICEVWWQCGRDCW